MLKYFYINTDKLTDEEIIDKINTYFKTNGCLSVENKEIVKFDGNNYKILLLEHELIYAEKLDKDYHCHISYESLDREDLIKICQICKNLTMTKKKQN